MDLKIAQSKKVWIIFLGSVLCSLNFKRDLKKTSRTEMFSIVKVQKWIIKISILDYTGEKLNFTPSNGKAFDSMNEF